MALKRIFDLTTDKLASNIVINNVTETIILKENKSSEVIATVNAGETWSGSPLNYSSIGVFIGTTLIAGGAAGSLVGGNNGCWMITNDAGNFEVSKNYRKNSSTILHCYADIPEATTSSIRVTGNLVESVTVNDGTAQSLPHTFDLNEGINTMVIEGVPRLEYLAIEGDYDSVTYGSSSYPKPADITLDPATSVLTVVNPVKEITVKYTDTKEPTVTVTTTM